MKRLIVLFLALGFVAVEYGISAVKAEDKPKDKKADKKDDKKDADKPKGDAKPSAEQKKELEKLSGTFTVIVFETDGKKKTADELKKMKVVQKGAEWTFSDGDADTQGKDTVTVGKTPNQIDSTYTKSTEFQGKTVKGIYKVEGDTITYCWAEPDGARPTEFATKADSKLTLMVLKRVTEKKADDKPKDKPKDADKPKEKEKPKDKPKDDDKDKDKE